jgi:phosphomannomutase
MKTFLSSRGIVNGIKLFFEGEGRWLLIRASETENIVRFYAEGLSDDEVDTILSGGTAILQKN